MIAADPVTDPGNDPGSLAASRRIPALWGVAAAAVLAFALSVTWLSASFGYDRDVGDMPVLALAGLMVGAGLIFAWLMPRLIARSDTAPFIYPGVQRTALAIMIAAGLAARLVLFASEPALEDDYQRYLWDGAVTASLINPYAATPRDVRAAGPETALGQLKAQSGDVLTRVNHPHLATIYPPVAQAAFGLAHVLEPWSLTAWRTLLLIFDTTILACLLWLLAHTNRSPLLAALYWLNPLVLKEAFNSAHMEPLVIALVMITLVLAVKRQPVLAVTALGLAAGAKLWPVLLLPLIVRPLTGEPRKLALALIVFAGLLALWMTPIALAGFGDDSGFRAYAEHWKTNSALFPMLETIAAGVFVWFGGTATAAALAVKAALGLGLGVIALLIARPAIERPEDTILRAGLVVAALLLLSPAQYPWYVLWVLPFLAFWPSRAFLLLSAVVPLYYASFHFAARETLEAAAPIIVALIWLPVWAVLAFEIRRHGTRPVETPLVRV